MENILITGAYGFIGTNLAGHFSKDPVYRLFALDITGKKNSLYDSYYTWENMDLIDWDKLDTIIHLAGIAHDTNNNIQKNRYFDINVGLTKKIFNYYIRSGARKFIFLSSVKAVADSMYDDILTEDAKPEPHTSYGKSKLAAEQFLLSQQIPEHKKVYILRPCMIHGPGNKGNLDLLNRFIRRGIPYPFGAFMNERSFTSIGNLNFVIQQIIERDIMPGIYQVADDEPLSTQEVIKQMGIAINKNLRIWKINQQLIWKIARLGDKINLPINTERLKKLTENYVVSNEKLVRALGTTLPISSRDGLLNTFRNFKDI